MAYFAIITLIICLLALSHLYNWAIRAAAAENGLQEITIIFGGVVYLALNYLILKWIVIWAPQTHIFY